MSRLNNSPPDPSVIVYTKYEILENIQDDQTGKRVTLLIVA